METVLNPLLVGTDHYSIHLALNKEAVGKINAIGHKVTLVKATVGTNHTIPPLAVAWLAFSPTQNNEIVWQSNYSLYATMTPLTPNAVLFVNSETPGAAMARMRYSYHDNLFVDGPIQLPAGQYGVFNDQADSIHFGLLQQVTVNNMAPVLSPINSVPMLYKQSAVFVPREILYVFLS
ncbi:MAG: hypothetical protein JWN14_3083, partial [Chthonomonadales bacterium]|nr:hypothetical protein [Chthonomonadales bacterium]